MPEGTSSSSRPPIGVNYAVRGFKVDGKTDQAVALDEADQGLSAGKGSDRPQMEFLNGSGKAIDTILLR